MAKDTLILSADTSSSRLSIALLKGDSLIGQFEGLAKNRHSSDMVWQIDEMLSKNSYSIKDVNAFCIGLGPGSFTGLRVGITTMKGLSLSLKKPIVGIPSIDGIAYNLFGYEGGICPIIDAKQGKVYARIYNCNNKAIRPKTKILLVTIKELLDVIKGEAIFLGDGVALYRDDIVKHKGLLAEFAPEPFWYPKAAIIGRMGLERLKAKKADNIFGLSPIYIYPKECQIKKANGAN